MQHHLVKSLVLAAACLSLGACSLLDRFKDDGTPTTPGATVSLDAFAGTWSSTTASTPATGCGNLKYTVTPLTTTSATVTFEGTCAGTIKVTGSGAGNVQGSSLVWTAQGLVSQGGVNCPFNFPTGKATQDATGTIKVEYTGTVCGIPVSGSEIVKKPLAL